MRLLYDEQHEREDRYTYCVNSGGDLRVDVGQTREARRVTIVLVNGKLDRVEWTPPNGKPFLRSVWRLYGAIAAKIDELESRAAGPTAVAVGD
jgi:hypothetical protein